MEAPTLESSWRQLSAHVPRILGGSMRDRFATDPERFERYSLQAGGLFLDYSKQLIDDDVLGALLALAEARGVADRRAAMFAGQAINTTENRAVLHAALRSRSSRAFEVDGVDVVPGVREVLQQMRTLCERVILGAWKGHTGRPITDVVNIGIGGSDLGPRFVCEALSPYANGRLRAHFVANVDGTDIARTLQDLDPETTLFIVASKTFTTQETLTNARTARQWLLARLKDEAAVAAHFVAVSTNAAEVSAFGIDVRNMLGFWDWVGGRYSLWSAIGLSIALHVGMEHFEGLLTGACEMDEHFEQMPFAQNMPVLVALAGIWNTNFLGCGSHAVIPYDEYLGKFPAYLQQLEMESNGKGTTLQGEPVDWATAPVVWGAPGTNGQHAFFQQLHQGPARVPVDFIVAARSHNPLGEHQQLLLANCLAQSQALMRGRTVAEAKQQLLQAGKSEQEAQALAGHRYFPGNRPSNTILMEKLSPRELGNLIALYEHKVFVQGVIWGINSFDQWGVELGKELARVLAPALAGGAPGAGQDASTAGLIAKLSELGGAA